MNAVKRQRPNISPDDVDRLLFHLEDARNYIIKYGAAQEFHSQNKATTDKAKDAIDNLAELITGNKQYFWGTSASATGNDMAFELAKENNTKRRRLMGIHIPVRAIKIVGKFI